MNLAAVLAVALGFGLFTLVQEMMTGGTKMAGGRGAPSTAWPAIPAGMIRAGETIDAGEEVRTTKGSTALVRMDGGSLIEMNERAGFSLEAGRKGNAVQLERGRVSGGAAKRRNRHLFVATRDAAGLGGRRGLRRQQRHQGVPRVGGRRVRSRSQQGAGSPCSIPAAR